MSGVQTISVKPADADQRLDRWFKQHFPALSFGHLQKLLRTGQIRVGGKRTKADYRLTAGDEIRIPPAPGIPAGINTTLDEKNATPYGVRSISFTNRPVAGSICAYRLIGYCPYEISPPGSGVMPPSL